MSPFACLASAESCQAFCIVRLEFDGFGEVRDGAHLSCRCPSATASPVGAAAVRIGANGTAGLNHGVSCHVLYYRLLTNFVVGVGGIEKQINGFVIVSRYRVQWIV